MRHFHQMPFSATEGDFRLILGVLHRVHKLSQSLAEEAKVWEECVLKSPREGGDKEEGENNKNEDHHDDDGEEDNDENPPPLQPVLVPSQLLSIMRDLRNEMISVLRLQGRSFNAFLMGKR